MSHCHNNFILLNADENMIPVLDEIKIRHPEFVNSIIETFQMPEIFNEAMDSNGSIRFREHLEKIIEEQASQNRMLRAITKSNHTLLRADNEDQLLRDICSIIVEDCGYKMVWIGFPENDEGKSVRAVALSGLDEGYVKNLNLSWSADTVQGRGPTGTAIREGRPQMCRDMRVDPQFLPWREEALKRGFASSLVIPLVYSGKVLGAITIYSREVDAFTDKEIELLSDLASDLAYGINTIRTRLELERAEEARQMSEYKCSKVREVSEKEISLARQEKEEKAREAEEGRQILEALMQFIPEGITIADTPDCKLRMVSHYGLQKLGVDFKGMTAAEVASQWKVYQKDGLTPMADSELPLIKAMNNGEILNNIELVQINDSGQKLPLLCNAAPILNKYGKITGAVVAWRDISDYRQMEEDLRQKENLIRDIIESIKDVFYALDSEWRFTYVNNRALEIWSKSREELIGRSFLEIFPQSIGTHALLNLEKALKERVAVHYETFSPILHEWIDVHTYPINDGGVTVYFRDITDRKKAEADLEEANERFDNVLNTLPDPFFILDSEWRYVYVNDAATRALKKTREELLGNVVWEVLPSMIGTERYKKLLQVAADKKPQIFTAYSHIIKRWYDYMAYPWKDGITLIMLDVTEKKNAETELIAAKQEAELRAREAEEGKQILDTLLEYVPEGIGIFTYPDMKLMTISRYGKELFGSDNTGLSAEQAARAWTVYYEDGITPMPLNETPIMKAIISGQVVNNMKMLAINGLGHKMPMLSVAAPIINREGEITGAITAYRDITEMVKAEEELKRLLERQSRLMKELESSEMRFRLALDSSPVAIYTLDRHLRYTWIYQSLFKRANEDFIGKTDQEVFGRFAPRLKEIYTYVLEKGEKINQKVSAAFDGHEYHFDLTVEPLVNENSDIYGLACASVDITRMVMLEEEKKKQEVAHLIERAARLASVGVIAGGITHEINQPLNAIRVGVDGILFWNRHNKNVLPEIFVDMLLGISDGVKKIDEIIKGMRTFWANIGKDTIEVFDLNQTIESIASHNMQKLNNHAISLRLDVQDEMLEVKANKLQIELVVNNLVNNAIYALEKTNRADKTICLRSYSDHNYIILDVDDNGTGLPDVPEDKLFDPFFTTKPSQEGSGLGLAIVKMFLDKNNASITAFNNESGGATFRIIFEVRK